MAFALHVVLHEARDFESFLVTAQANKYTASQRGYMKIPGTCINNFIKLGAPSSVSFFISIMVVCTPCWSEFRELEPVAESVSSPSSAKCNELDDPKLSAASLLFELMPCRCNFRVTDPVLLFAVDD